MGGGLHGNRMAHGSSTRELLIKLRNWSLDDRWDVVHADVRSTRRYARLADDALVALLRPRSNSRSIQVFPPLVPADLVAGLQSIIDADFIWNLTVAYPIAEEVES